MQWKKYKTGKHYIFVLLAFPADFSPHEIIVHLFNNKTWNETFALRLNKKVYIWMRIWLLILLLLKKNKLK